MTRRALSPEALAAIVAAMRDVVTTRLPDWTDTNSHDPGVTLLEIFAFAVEETAFRADVPPGRAEAAIARILHAVSRLERHGARIRVSVDGEPWHPVESLDAARPEDRVFATDGDGVVTFGDGLHGAMPPAGSDVRLTFATGRGHGGNRAVTVSDSWPFDEGTVELFFCKGSARIVRRP